MESLVTKLILLVVSILLCYKSSAQCSNTVTVVRVDVSQATPCNDEVRVCRSLQDAVNYVSRTLVNSSDENVVIQIPDGQHYITNPTHFGNKSVHFIGSVGDNVTVLCDYYANENTTNSNEMHTWYFEYSESVVLSNIYFRGCGFPIRLSTIQSVQVHNCTFRYFTQAVLDIFNCQNVSVLNIVVEHNRGTVTFHEEFRGNTGGVAIGYNSLPADFTQPTVKVINSTFINNSALSSVTIEAVITSQIFVGRGGGLGFFIDESIHPLSISVSGCTFKHNFANLLGGGLFMVMFSYNTVKHYMLIEKCQVISNVAVQSGGGGIQLSHELIVGDSRVQDTIQVRECNFVNNRSPAGGGLYIVPGNDGFFQVERCNFTGNEGFQSRTDYGGALGISVVSVFIETVTLPRHQVKDCIFVGNSGENGIVTIGYTPVLFSGTNYFIDNTGPSLQIVGALVEFQGYMKFANNTLSEEIAGSLNLLSFAQMRFYSGFQIEFNENIGRIGAAIALDAPTSLSVFNELLFNPQCFVLYEERTTPPTEWENVRVLFNRNQALVGSAFYGSQITNCAWSSPTTPFFNKGFIPNWPLWRYNNNINRGYTDPLNQTLSFGTAAEAITMFPEAVSAWPGQRISMVVTGLDQFKHSTIANARFSRLNFGTMQNPTSEILRFDPGIAVIADNLSTGLLNNNFTFTYKIINSSFISNSILGVFSIDEPFLHIQPDSTTQFTLQYLGCPGGYNFTRTLRNDFECTCVDVPEIVACEDDQNNIILKNGIWAGYTPLRQPNLFFYPCPSGYCQCTLPEMGNTCFYKFTNSDHNQQCHVNREGVLCGKCRDGRGVSALLQTCVSSTCSNGYGALIAVLIVADIIVFVAITLWNIPLPGWLHPFLFYIQIAPYVSQYYPHSFEQASKYLYYFSSGTSFYFIYDFCLYESMSPQVSYVLRYLPACLAAIVFTIIWLIRKYVMTSKIMVNQNGYWWFVLLSFSLVVHTSLSILNCPNIPTEDGSITSRWFINGEVECLKGGHLVLSLIAVFVLILCVVSLVLVTILPLKKQKGVHLKRFIKPLTLNYEEEVRWWSGVELGRRFLFLLFFMYFPRNTVYTILVLVVTIAVYGYVQPYKSRVANILELVVQINFLIFMLLEATTFVRESLFKFSESVSSNNTRSTSEPQGISFLSWLLLPFYYFPLILLIIAGCSHIIIIVLRRKLSKRNRQRVDGSVDKFSASMKTHKSPLFIAQSVWIDGTSSEGMAAVKEASQSVAIINHVSSAL